MTSSILLMQVEFSGSRGSRNSADSVATCVNTNSGTSDDSSTRGKTETRDLAALLPDV